MIVLAKIVDLYAMDDEERYGESFDNPIPKGLSHIERWKWMSKNRAEYPPTKFVLEVVETIKGTPQTPLSIDGYKLDSIEFQIRDHSKQSFWRDEGGRTVRHYASCEFVPAFSKGFTYLVFLSKPYHNKSFELILDLEHDKWLQYVREKVKEQASELSDE